MSTVDNGLPEGAAEPHVVVVGAGFAGLRVARGLDGDPVKVTLVDRRNHHLFQPLLYQVATAALSPADIAAPIRHLLRKQANARVLLGEVAEVDPEGRRVLLADGRPLSYDYLVLATGTVDRYFGNDEWAAHAPGLKSIENAIRIRRRFLLAFESAEEETDPETCRELLTFVVIGGGPTGVEMAGAFAEVARHTLTGGDFRNVDPAGARVVLLEAMPNLLSMFPEELGERAKRDLEELGVEVHLETMVTGIEDGVVRTKKGDFPTRNVVWGAGQGASPLGGGLGVETDKQGRVPVEADLSVPGRPEVFVVGDLARFEHQGDGPLPALAPVAIQQGKRAAENIVRSVKGRDRKAFRYRDRGSLATIGRGAAVGEIAGRPVDGVVAWLVWLFVHLLYLVGFRNRVAVLLEWGWSYLTWQRGARLITSEPEGEG